jgi:hypothetical protein
VQLGPEFEQFCCEHNGGKRLKQSAKAHCKRELFHGCWDILLDDEFVHAYEHGILILCADGITRRLFPRIFVYCADYPEKLVHTQYSCSCLIAYDLPRILICTIRDMGLCPCPCCKVRKSDIHLLGTPEDMAQHNSGRREDTPARRELVEEARRQIYEGEFRAVSSTKYIETLLKDESYVPTRVWLGYTWPNCLLKQNVQNAFSKLAPLGMNVFSLPYPDGLHDYDSGWKAKLIHIIRIVKAHDKATKRDTEHELNER